jgi:hypothetical protein
MPVFAQDQPFVFSVTLPSEPVTKPSVLVAYDVGVGEQPFRAEIENGPEQRIGMQASMKRWTFLARVGVATASGAYETTSSGEVLYSLLSRATSSVGLAVGGGLLHEAGGADVWLARVVADRKTDNWRVGGNVLFQFPHGEPDRDPVDVISTAGWTRRVSRSVGLGVEGIGEDLEGFWDPAEAEGGARLLIGPSLHVAPPAGKWQVTVTGGPMFHPTNSDRSSAAVRDLPPITQRTGYAMRASVACTF